MTALWCLLFLAAGLAAGVYLATQHHRALRDDRYYLEQAYWVTRDRLERLETNLRWLARNPRLFHRVVLRAQRIAARREHVA